MKKLLIAALLITMISGVSAQSTGAAPSFQNLGEVQPGQTIKATVYVTGTYEEAYAVVPEAQDPLTSKFLDPESSPISVQEYSEEDIRDWVVFDQNSYTVTPSNSTPYVLSNGAEVNANGEVTFNIRIPNDAEPGWHAGAISLNPQSSSSVSGYGATAEAVTQPAFVFDVQGVQEPERLIEVVDVRGIRTGENSARIDMRIANRGTVTTSVRSADIDVYNRETGNKSGELQTGTKLFAPGQTEVVSFNMESGSLEAGNYALNGTLDYSSSEAFIGQQTFTLASQIRTNPEDPDDFDTPDQTSDGSSTPLWLLGMFVLVLAAVMYSFGFDLFWIIIGAGFIGIGLFILISPASNWLLLILLTTPVIIMYYV